MYIYLFDKVFLKIVWIIEYNNITYLENFKEGTNSSLDESNEKPNEWNFYEQADPLSDIPSETIHLIHAQDIVDDD